MARPARGGGRSAGGLSLRTTFFLVALVSLLPALGLLAYFAYAQIGHEKGRVQREALGQARALASQLEAHMTTRLDALAALGEGLAAAGLAGADGQVRRYRQSYPDFDQVLLTDQVGAVVAAAAPLPEGRRPVLGDQEWFKRAATSPQPILGEPRQAAQDLVIGVYAPVRTADGQLKGVIAADLSLKRIQDLLMRARLRSGTVAEVMTEGGTVLVRQPPPILVPNVAGLPGYSELLSRPDAVGELVFDDSERRLAGSAQVRPVGWMVAVGLPAAQVLADTSALFTKVAGGAAAAAVLSLALALMIGGRAASGMARLRAAMSRLSAGDIPTSVPITAGGEVGALTEGFNHVVSWLRNKLREYEALSQVEEAAGAAIGTDRSKSAALPDLLRKVVGGMGADVGVLLMQEEAGLVTKAAVGFGGIPTEGVTLRRSQGLGGAVVAGRETIVVEDVEADYRVEEPYIKAAGLRSLVAVPIVSGDRVVGAIEVGYRNAHTFTEAEIQRLEVMARRTAQTVEHERAMDDVRRNTVGLEAKLAEQMEALQKAATEQAEAKRQAQEARRQTAELQQTIRMQVSQVQVKEVVKADPAAEEGKRVRAALQKTVSEELRAPLTALMDLPRYLVDGVDKPLDREAQQQLEVLHTRGEEIIELIDNLVVLSSVHGGQVKIAKSSFNLPELIQRVVRAVQPRAAARGNRIVAEVKPGVTQVVSDAKRFEQVVTNLVVTSAKYTELGEIRVTCEVKGTDVVLVVADDGSGFTTDEQARLFQPFLQVAPRAGRKLPGTGLLLNVCERLVQLLGGKITVQSEVDRGTSITVTLPAQS